MVSLKEKDFLTEGCSLNPDYGGRIVLQVPSAHLISETEFRAVGAVLGERFLEMRRLSENGEPRILYLTQGKEPLSAVLPTLSMRERKYLLSSLTDFIREIREHGFLDVRKIPFQENLVFLDREKLELQFLYFPVPVRTDAFPERLSAFQYLLSDETGRGGDEILYGEAAEPHRMAEEPYEAYDGARSRVSENVEIRGTALVSEDQKMHFILSKSPFVLGTKRELVDGLVDWNRRVSRIHCRLEKVPEGAWWVFDMDSKNGTFVNGIRVDLTGTELHGGDRISLADAGFIFTEE